ncbi:MAG: hypothetical protein WC600_03885 [Desulfobaccales bacterium]
MKRIVFLGFWLIACGTLLVGVWANGQMLGGSSSDPDSETEPSRCFNEATIRVTASPSTVTLGQSSVVSWSVGLPNGCSAVHVRLNGEAVATSGSRSVSPSRSTTYTVRISETRLGVYAEKSESTRVEVAYPPRVVIDPNTLNPVQVLIGALVDSTNDEQTVELGCVDLDLTGHSLDINRDNRSLIASPDCARGPRRLGPRIFVTDKNRGRSALFMIRGDNIRFSGFRLQGPTSGIGQGDDNKEKGILISPLPATGPIHNIEISNMEIFHWSGVGVQVDDNVDMAERGRLFNTNVGAVRIRNNYFHHNRHGAGEGYGVSSTAGAYVLIEQNVFDENRHAIAGGSKNSKGNDYSGYTARDNLILSGGGKHCSEFFLFALTGWRFNCWQTHQIDMHGDKNEWYSSHNWQCGTAGETIIIQRNTILYTSGLAIKIRGNPADKAVVDGNVFKHKSRSDAIVQNGECGWGDDITNPIDVRPNNVFKADPITELGSGDFFGDGKQDQFMATGVTWWAKSPTTLQWRYLNTMPERLPQLQLGKIDGDTVCDVAPRTRRPEIRPEKYSKGGTTPWLPLNVIKQ